jgi:hypothetical protein
MKSALAHYNPLFVSQGYLAANSLRERSGGLLRTEAEDDNIQPERRVPDVEAQHQAAEEASSRGNPRT